MDILSCGAGMDNIPAGTGDGGLIILWMNLLFQNLFLLYLVAANFGVTKLYYVKISD